MDVAQMDADNIMTDSDSSISEPQTPRGFGRVLSLIKSDGKYFNDPIHGHFKLQPITCAFVDTRPYQRLRKLKQLGFAYYVYPGASHNRFEHCLGVAHLSGKWAQELMRLERRSHEDIDRYSTLLEIAGLCHDIGHGPFSHTWEHGVLPSLGVHNWHHEDMSMRLVEYMVQECGILDGTNFGRSDVQFVQSLIAGEKPRISQDVPLYLFDIVNNRTNGIDVDKLDYLQRDSLYTNVHVAAPYDRLLRFAKPIDADIAFRLRERDSLKKVYQDRFTLYSDVYYHKTCRAIDLMVCDALKEIGHELQIAKDPWNLEKFLSLNDGLLDFILNFYKSATPGAAKAKHLLERIERRDLYRLCGEMYIPPERIPVFINGVPPVEITSWQTVDGQVNLTPDDIHVNPIYINCGMKGRDPLERTTFYSERPTEMCVVDRDSKPLQNLWIRVYCKQKEHQDAVRTAFDRFKRLRTSSPTNTTPDKQEYRRNIPRSTA